MYSLKLYNDTLVKFDMENNPTLKIFNIDVVSSRKKLFPEVIRKEVTSETLKVFLKQKLIPRIELIKIIFYKYITLIIVI